ncbi:MAG TPA: cell wall hydrolase [Alphaproteobacteria bacterium]|nr:cell wall hydrolase [Alphaproteobacteria bacterium]
MALVFDKDILARTIYGEARGEYFSRVGGLSALIAVGNVVLNRMKRKKWFGTTVREVCLKPFQFSCWNEKDPNFRVVKSVSRQDPIFEICYHVAEQLCDGRWPDLTQNADHYYAVSMKIPPAWAKDKKPTIQIGGHVFFNLEASI